MKTVNQSVRKKDAMALVTGKPVFLEDVLPEGYLTVKLLRSPHANAMVESVDAEAVRKLPGIIAVYTWEDVPCHRFTLAGQTYPEPSPYDRLILDRHVRYVGDPVAIVAGESEEAVDRALKRIRVRYQVLPALLDFHESKDGPVLVHPEENWEALCPVGADNRRNLCASGESSEGDVDQVLADCDQVLERTYHTKANQQTMMETFRTACHLDAYGRLHVESSTQIVFHVRRILARALGISKSQIRVSKPRIGGGFGAKQTAVSEVYPAFVTWKTGKPSKIVFTREESQIASSPRHEMEVRVRLGANRDGQIRAIEVYTLSNTGAYGEHGPTTVGLSGHKSIPLYGKLEAFRFSYDVVYTNVMSAGAYRGYGATQGIFAVESAVNELAERLGMDPVALRQQNMVREGQRMPAYYGEPNTSCALDRCLRRAAEQIRWKEKFPRRVMPDGKIRSVGVAMAMQGSGIAGVDTGSATIKQTGEDTYQLLVGAADMGTGCDTTLAQIAAQCLDCPLENIGVLGADTDASPYDSGSYASSTAYVTGKAVEMACQKLREKQEAGEQGPLEVTVSHTSPVSPPPFMVGMVEIELDPETGHVEILNYTAVLDCGTPINPNLVRVQAEGGIVQGMGMALYEDIQYTDQGRLRNNSLAQYRIPTRLDMGTIHVELESSYEPSGPFGAKSVGEIVINTPSPALAHAIAGATGLWFRELPITSEKIAMARAKRQKGAE